jgi:hypothetical protein
LTLWLLRITPVPFVAFALVVLSWPEHLGIRPGAAIYVALTVSLFGCVIGFFTARTALGAQPAPEHTEPPPDVMIKATNTTRLIFAAGFAILLAWTMTVEYWNGSLVRAAQIAFASAAFGGAFGWIGGHLFVLTIRAMFQPPKGK